MNPNPTHECNQLERLEKYGEKLEKYGEKLEQLGGRLTSLEVNQKHMGNVFESAEIRIMGVIADLREIVEEGFAGLDKRLFVGNGRPSLEQRVDKLEARVDREDGAAEQANRFWVRLQPWIPWITAVAGAAAMYFVKGALKQ